MRKSRLSVKGQMSNSLPRFPFFSLSGNICLISMTGQMEPRGDCSAPRYSVDVSVFPKVSGSFLCLSPALLIVTDHYQPDFFKASGSLKTTSLSAAFMGDSKYPILFSEIPKKMIMQARPREKELKGRGA